MMDDYADVANEALKALAASGALCARCGGIHHLSIDIIILAVIAEMPLCECAACESCGSLREEINRLALGSPGEEG